MKPYQFILTFLAVVVAVRLLPFWLMRGDL